MTATVPRPMTQFLFIAQHFLSRMALPQLWLAHGLWVMPVPGAVLLLLTQHSVVFVLALCGRDHITGLTRDPERRSRWSKPRDGADCRNSHLEVPSWRDSFSPCTPRGVKLLSQCLIQRLESINNQSKEQKRNPLIKSMFSGACA